MKTLKILWKTSTLLRKFKEFEERVRSNRCCWILIAKKGSTRLQKRSIKRRWIYIFITINSAVSLLKFKRKWMDRWNWKLRNFSAYSMLSLLSVLAVTFDSNEEVGIMLRFEGNIINYARFNLKYWLDSYQSISAKYRIAQGRFYN